MPKPGKKETHDDFIGRCIPIVINEGTAKDNKQAYAICESIWERSKNKKKSDDPFSGVLNLDEVKPKQPS